MAAETIQRRKLFKGGNYMRKYKKILSNCPNSRNISLQNFQGRNNSNFWVANLENRRLHEFILTLIDLWNCTIVIKYSTAFTVLHYHSLVLVLSAPNKTWLAALLSAKFKFHCNNRITTWLGVLQVLKKKYLQILGYKVGICLFQSKMCWFVYNNAAV